MIFNFESTCTNGNCGMQELHGFDSVLTEKGDVLKALWSALDVDGYGNGKLPGILLFSGNRFQSLSKHSSPHAFAKYLRSQKEKVIATPWARNNNYKSGRKTIRAYLWTPSATMQRRYIAAVKRFRKEQRQNHASSQDHWSTRF